MLTIDKGSVSSVDALEQALLEGEAAVARIRAHQIQALARLDVAQVHTADGTRTRVEWVSARLDVSMDTAKALVDGSKMLPDRARLGAGVEDVPVPGRSDRRT